MVRLLPLLSLLACVHEVEPRIDTAVPTATPPVTSAPWERPFNDQLVINPARTVPEPIAAIPTFRQPLASTPILQSHDGELLFNVDTDNGTVVRVDRTDGATTTAIVGTEPTRLARAASTLYVTLRGDRRITKLDSDLQVLASQHVGAEPYGIVARTDGSRVYVTVSQQREVLELDGDTLEILARIPVPNEPRYLAITPDGMGLYVGSTRGEARVTKIDLVDFSAVPIDLPTAFRDFDSAAPLTVRLTGDFSLATLPSGITQLAIPALYVDVNTPIPDLSSVEDIEEQVPAPPNGGDGGEGVEGGYGSGGEGVERLNPAIVTVQVGNESAVEQPIFVSSPITDGFLQGNGLISQSVRSYITGVAHTPDGYLAASLEANSAVVFVRTDRDPLHGLVQFFGQRTAQSRTRPA